MLLFNIKIFEKMKIKSNTFIRAFVAMLLLTVVSCTNLDETLRSTIDRPTAEQTITAQELLNTVYIDLELFSDPAIYFAMQEHSSDELIGPTRGGDWDDNGQWRQMHSQSWTADHPFVGNVFNRLLTGVFNANEVIAFGSAEADQVAQALFLRSLFIWCVADLYGQVPFREAGKCGNSTPHLGILP